jgi:glutamate formiminotransferase/formiminotetrahydrofolate cyclodeaminase
VAVTDITTGGSDTMKLIECVPNFSEGRDLAVITRIRDAIAAVEGVSILHVTSDASHNRSVITFVAPYETMADAAFAAIQSAQTHIDLTRHVGVHPRMGATDVVPFIPLDGATMEDCIALARIVGERVGRELEIPVYLYERAATREAMRNLAVVRRGGFEAIQKEIATNPDRAPDYGPRTIHPTAGAVAIGARPFLIAFNVYLGDKTNLPIAKQVARAVRESSGGLPSVKALGLEVDGQAQVSMNLVDIEKTPLSTAFAEVARQANQLGADVIWSEIIGLVPERAVFETASKYLRLKDDVADHVLERKILEIQTGEQTLRGFVNSVGSDLPTPGGGSVAAYAGALGAALAKMVAGITVRTRAAKAASAVESNAPEGKDELLTIVDEAGQCADQLAVLTQRDADAYAAVVEAYAMPRATEIEREAREDTIREKLLQAARIPLEVIRLCARVSALLSSLVEHGKRSVISDVGVAALMTEAACKAAQYNILVNVQALDGPGTEIAREAESLIQTVSHTVGTVLRQVDQIVRPSSA